MLGKVDKLYEHIPLEKKEYVKNIVDTYHSWLYNDADIYPLELVNGVIRFKGDIVINKLWELGIIDCNKLAVLEANGDLTNREYRHLMKRLGYSLGGYEDLAVVQKWIIVNKELKEYEKWF